EPTGIRQDSFLPRRRSPHSSAQFKDQLQKPGPMEISGGNLASRTHETNYRRDTAGHKGLGRKDWQKRQRQEPPCATQRYGRGRDGPGDALSSAVPLSSPRR